MSQSPLALARAIALACLEKKAEQIALLDVRQLVSYADYVVVCSGRSDRQVKAIADGVARELSSTDEPVKARGIEGDRVGRWVLMDFEDVILHVFLEELRMVYDLERLWFDAPRINPATGEACEESQAAGR